MATLTLIPNDEAKARRRMDLPLLPIASDADAVALSTSQRFGPFVPGDAIVISSTAAFYALAGASDVAATSASGAFAAGAYHFALPDGCTHVAMLDTAAGAGLGQAYLG